jgi:hypothetical protein
MMYERRIENSLYKTMTELHKLRLMRDEPAGSACSVPARALKRTPCGVTTNGADSTKQSQSADNPPGPPVETQHLASPPAPSATKESARADSDLPCETKPMELVGSACSVPARAYPEPAEEASEETPCGVTTNARQSQSADDPHGHPVETQNVASLPAGPATKEPARADSDLPCETKPIEPAGSVCSVPARAYPEPAEEASEETPCGVTTNARQSQSADNAPVETQHLASPPVGLATKEPTRADSDLPCETKPIEPAGSVCSVPARAYPEPAEEASEETPCGVTTNAKQSQRRGSTIGVIAVPRPRPRVACHSHNVARSY